MKCGMKISIKGIVQGVGFRPFIYNLARSLNLSGYILNNTTGVSIEAEGERSDIQEFIESIKKNHPPQAEIFEIQSKHTDFSGYPDFEIRESTGQEEKFVPISPELSTCNECLAELFNPQDRRFRYPFINCTNCGPRFTIIQDIPYDRKFTTMSVFSMCERCDSEYHDPANRRFHAQPNACSVCGPRLFLFDVKKREIPVIDVISEACRLLMEGKIIAIKGLGGYHLACDAQNNDAVSILRARKFREYKPFALMVKDIRTAKEICFVDEKEEQLLNGVKRPIVLMKKRPDAPVSEGVAPNQKYFGVMLPYTPLHSLLLAESGLILVMTSANISSEPIVFEDKDVFERLSNITDYYIIHNREIHIRTDDSVIRVHLGKDVVLRRSRGYAPHPLLMKRPFAGQILACGAELKNTFCLTRDNYAFLSHHIGDLENMETLSSFEKGIEHFKKMFNIEPAVIAYDLHPEYLSTKYAHSLKNIKKVGIQHHHAHIVSCMGDNGLEGEMIGVSFDGTGYGTDGKIWGGEFLVCNSESFQRVAHFEYFQLNGGEKAIKEPWRITASLLHEIYGDDMMNLNIDFIRELDKDKWHILKQMIVKGINSPMTSSAGRLFDAVSALLGIRKEIHYEGQAAIELEMKADSADIGRYQFDYKEHEGKTEIVLEPVIKGIVADLEKGTGIGSISARFHNTVAGLISDMCLKLRDQTALNRVALSGGVFQNSLLMEKTYTMLDENGFKVYTHHRVPTNDGGLALGQAIIASEMIRTGKTL
jgi:hydrogenase maturation protein HypF